MSTLELTYTVDEIDDVDDPIGRLVEFYRHNGYELQERTSSDVTLRRGRHHAGWWASDMTRLHTEVSIAESDPGLELHYRIETTGQLLDNADRRFWDDEAEAAAARARDQRPLADLRPREAQRAARVKTELRRTGLHTALIVSVTVAALGIVAHFLGWL